MVTSAPRKLSKLIGAKCILAGGRILFARVVVQGALIFITTAYFAIVGVAATATCGISVSVFAAEQGYWPDRIASASVSATNLGNRAKNSRPGHTYKHAAATALSASDSDDEPAEWSVQPSATHADQHP
jgi:hypothetical protein